MHALKLFVEGKGVTWRDDSRENIFKAVLEAVDKEWEITLPEIVSEPKESSKQEPPDYDGIFI